ncbi:hypothetical protein C2L64_00865 [Paraburkholderia hospita]|uniref:Uncharacterized protein n=1 Tax=Paraburkholderia hospita TaxID=169430 RepID=A0AAN1J5X0_9BURK|nr:hypothetical protein C2L64_00865 [Paraburkholderia hospita]
MAWALVMRLLAVATLAGCSTYAVAGYSISADNVVALKSIAPRSARGVFCCVAQFTLSGQITLRPVLPRHKK